MLSASPLAGSVVGFPELQGKARLMRILMANALYPPDRTGSSVFTQQLADALRGLGAEVFVLTSHADPRFDFADSLDVVRLPVRRVNIGRLAWDYTIPLSISPRNWRRIRREIARLNPDVVICHGQIFDLTWLVAIAARLARIPCQVVVHTAIWHERRLFRLVLRTFEALFIKPLLRLSRVSFIAVDKWTHDNTVGRLANDQSIPVIPASVDVEKMRGGDSKLARHKYELGAGPILLSLGHVISLRNRVALVQALPLILSENPEIKLVIVGDVKDTEFIQVAQKLGVSNSILCLGSVPHEDIKHLLATAALEAHDLQGLGLGITSLEAMAAGVPIVAWAVDDNYPGYSLRQHEGIGFINGDKPEEIAAACNLLIGDDQARTKAIRDQHELVSKLFTKEAVARRYLELVAKSR